MCIDIVKIWFGIANGQISSNFYSYQPETCPYFHFPDDNLSKYQEILTKLGTCIDRKEIWFGIAYGQISIFDKSYLSARDTVMAGYNSLTFLFVNDIPELIWSKCGFFYGGTKIHAPTDQADMPQDDINNLK